MVPQAYFDAGREARRSDPSLSETKAAQARFVSRETSCATPEPSGDGFDHAVGKLIIRQTNGATPHSLEALPEVHRLERHFHSLGSGPENRASALFRFIRKLSGSKKGPGFADAIRPARFGEPASRSPSGRVASGALLGPVEARRTTFEGSATIRCFRWVAPHGARDDTGILA